MSPALVLLALGLAGPAREATPAGIAEPVELAWDAPSGCPGREALRERIEHHLGRALGEVPAGRVRARTRVETRGDGRFWATIVLQTPSGSGEREVDADSCAELTDGVAIVISLAIDTWLESQAEPEPEPEPEPAPPPAEPPTAPPGPDSPAPVQAPEAAPAPAADRVRATLALRPGLDVGTLPFGAAAALAIGVAGPHWRVAMVGSHHFRRPARFEAEPDVGVDMRLYTLGIEAAYAFAWTRRRVGLELPLRGGVELGPLVGHGVGVDAPTTARPVWVAASGGAGFAVVPEPRIALAVHADAVVPLLRPAFDVEPLGEVHRVRSAGFRAWAGVELRFSLERHGPPPGSR